MSPTERLGNRLTRTRSCLHFGAFLRAPLIFELMKPQRIQLRRIKGWKMPANTVIVDRRSRWGNPFRLQTTSEFSDKPVPVELARMCAAAHFRNWVDGTFYADVQRELRGKNLACWCPLGQACHADVLLAIANK